jgi:hypothetical protein
VPSHIGHPNAIQHQRVDFKKKTPARCFSFFTTFLGSYLLIKRFSITNLPMVRKQPEVIKFVRAKNSSANQKKIRTISIAIILSCFSSNVVRASRIASKSLRMQIAARKRTIVFQS